MKGKIKIQPENRPAADLSPQELGIRLPGARHFAVWLLPSEEDTASLGEIIRDLAVQFDAPFFPPHLTLYQGVVFDGDGIAKTLESLVSTLEPIDLKIRAIASSDILYKCIFISLIHQAMLVEMSQAIMLSLKHQEPYTLDPHVSLLYKELSQVERTHCLRQIQFPGKKITFDAMKVIRPAMHSNGWVDIKDWEVDSMLSMRGT